MIGRPRMGKCALSMVVDTGAHSAKVHQRGMEKGRCVRSVEKRMGDSTRDPFSFHIPLLPVSFIYFCYRLISSNQKQIHSLQRDMLDQRGLSAMGQCTTARTQSLRSLVATIV